MTAHRRRDPANELYDHACSLLDAAQGLRAAAGSSRSAPAHAAVLGCIESSLQELGEAIAELRDTALMVPPGAEADPDADCGEAAQVRAGFAVLARDLSSSARSCAAVRWMLGPLVATRWD